MTRKLIPLVLLTLSAVTTYSSAEPQGVIFGTPRPAPTAPSSQRTAATWPDYFNRTLREMEPLTRAEGERACTLRGKLPAENVAACSEALGRFFLTTFSALKQFSRESQIDAAFPLGRSILSAEAEAQCMPLDARPEAGKLKPCRSEASAYVGVMVTVFRTQNPRLCLDVPPAPETSPVFTPLPGVPSALGRNCPEGSRPDDFGVTPLRSGELISVRTTSLAELHWAVNYGRRIDDKGWYALGLSRDDWSTGSQFTFLKDGGGPILSHDTIRIAVGTRQYLIAEAEIHDTYVLSGSAFGPPRFQGTGTFVIDKIGAENGTPILHGDPFVIRGSLGDTWLTASAPAIRISQDHQRAATFVAAEPGVPPPPPPPAPPAPQPTPTAPPTTPTPPNPVDSPPTFRLLEGQSWFRIMATNTGDVPYRCAYALTLQWTSARDPITQSVRGNVDVRAHVTDFLFYDSGSRTNLKLMTELKSGITCSRY